MTPTPSLRVVQWATGTTGNASLRALIERHDLDLVGAVDTGIVATDDVDAILALAPDVVVYMGRPTTRARVSAIRRTRRRRSSAPRRCSPRTTDLIRQVLRGKQ